MRRGEKLNRFTIFSIKVICDLSFSIEKIKCRCFTVKLRNFIRGKKLNLFLFLLKQLFPRYILAATLFLLNNVKHLHFQWKNSGRK